MSVLVQCYNLRGFVLGTYKTTLLEPEDGKPNARHNAQPCECKLDFGVKSLTSSKEVAEKDPLIEMFKV